MLSLVLMDEVESAKTGKGGAHVEKEVAWGACGMRCWWVLRVVRIDGGMSPGNRASAV